MKPLELANRYLEIFYSGKNIQDLSQLFTNDLKFNGPFYTFDTPEAYVNSLLSNPPKDCKYSILHSYENATSACIIYQFSKPGVTLPMTQYFEVKSEKISKIFLIFDTGKFT